MSNNALLPTGFSCFQLLNKQVNLIPPPQETWILSEVDFETPKLRLFVEASPRRVDAGMCLLTGRQRPSRWKEPDVSIYSISFFALKKRRR